MRSIFVCSAFLALAASAGEPKSDSKDSCHITAGPNDLVKKKGNVVIEAGRTIENVIALHGQVTLKKGAKVKSIITVNGDAIIEDGAEVEESVVTIGGQVRVEPGGIVHGSKLALSDRALSVTGDNGKSVKGNLEIDGQSVSQLLLATVTQKLEGCAVEK